MKLNIWIEVNVWDLDNSGELKSAYVKTMPLDYPCGSSTQRFKAVLDIPYVHEPIKEATTESVEIVK